MRNMRSGEGCSQTGKVGGVINFNHFVFGVYAICGSIHSADGNLLLSFVFSVCAIVHLVIAILDKRKKP